MKYRAVRLNKNTTKFYCGEDIECSYYLIDENDNIVTNLSAFVFTAKLYSDLNDGTEYDQATYMTVSGAKVTLNIPNTLTTSFEYNERYILELSGTENNKIHTLIREEIYFGREI